MTYCITGLPRTSFTRYFAMNRQELAKWGARRVIADADRGFPCRVSLEDARAGESLILLNYISQDAATPYHTRYAIYVREQAAQSEPWVDRLPPVFHGRWFSLRGFDAHGMLLGASLAAPDETDQEIRKLFANGRIACIHAHNAAYGCFAARIERNGDNT